MAKCKMCNDYSGKYVVKNGDSDLYCYRCIGIVRIREDCIRRDGNYFDPEPWFNDIHYTRGFWDMFR